MNNHHLLKKWFITYLVLITISLTFIFIIYNVYMSSIKKNTDYFNKNYLHQVIKMMDSQTSAIKHATKTLYLHPKTFSLLKMSDIASPEDQYTLLQIQENLKMHNLSNNLIESILIYAHKPQLLIFGDSYYRDKYLDIFTQEKYQMNSVQFKRLMTQDYDDGKIMRLSHLHPDIIHDKKYPTTDVLFYIQTFPKSSLTARATLLVIFNEFMIYEILEHAKPFTSQGALIITDENNQLVFSSNEAVNPTILTENINDHGAYTIQTHHLQDYAVYLDDSTEDHWHYYWVIPLAVHQENINSLKAITLLTILFLALFMTLLAYYFSHNSYKPVKQLMRTIENPSITHTRNEFEYIASVFDFAKNRTKKMETIIASQSNTLLNNFLIKLLRGHYFDTMTIHDKLKEYDVSFTGNVFCCIVFDFHDDKLPVTDQQLNAFIIMNVFSEILKPKYTCYMLELTKHIVCLLNYTTQGSCLDLIEHELYTGIDLIKTQLHIGLNIGISNEYHHLNGLPTIYKEGVEAVNYSRMISLHQAMRYDEMQSFTSRYDLDFDMETRLLNTIRLGHTMDATRLVKKIIGINSRKQLQYDTLQCMMFDLFSIIMKSSTSTETTMPPITKMMHANTLDEMQGILETSIMNACHHHAEKLKQKDDNKLSHEITAYILRHYMNPDLNVAHLSDVFHLSTAHLSRIYKKDVGTNLNDAISNIRLDRAKEKLSTTHMTINDVAASVGYTYPNAFIRFFKKKTNITPGQYRSLYAKK
ncbi:helix-turn-helix transcriptional regulator [Vallitalea pronyensis]|uniref:Helix-turn-helix transcriptional regulator n=1 Tax=Vallitalea pronyensis TaxID=1348613 RepID=A0A8J8MIH3_9FIRM|nr:AraC family transcriptional regulator [Vallitalea pronyensis]QUI22204.1 helix-turn-helix transcriptional regulator [Vallitalea pronyensis]